MELKKEEKERTLLFANVKIPIEVKEDGTIYPLKDYITMEFSECTELPPKQETEVNYSFVMNNIKELLPGDSIKTTNADMASQTCEEEDSSLKEKEETHIMVLKEEIKNEKRDRKNSSFKSNPRNYIRHTIRTYS